MGHRTTRMAQGRERAREARFQRLLERQQLDDRIEDALRLISDVYPKSREARATWLQLELTVGQSLAQLAAAVSRSGPGVEDGGADGSTGRGVPTVDQGRPSLRGNPTYRGWPLLTLHQTFRDFYVH